MRMLIFVLLITGFNQTSVSQRVTCRSLHEGTFRVVTKETGTTLIRRTKAVQIEENTFLNYKVIFDIIWIDDCVYELRPKEVIKGDPSILGDGKNVLTVRIKGVHKKNYIAETSANFSNGIVDFEVEILD